MPVYLEALATEFYRGIGPERQYVCPLKEMNFFIGANNSGKSVILDILHQRLPYTERKGEQLSPTAAERFIGTPNGEPHVLVGCSLETIVDKLADKFPDQPLQTRSNEQVNPREFLRDLLRKLSQRDFVWLSQEKPRFGEIYSEVDIEELSSGYSNRVWEFIWHKLTNMTGGGFEKEWLPQTLYNLGRLIQPKVSQSLLIPAKRQLGKRGEDLDDLTGKGLIDHLAKLQNPSFHEQGKKKQFESINTFVREVANNEVSQSNIH